MYIIIHINDKHYNLQLPLNHNYITEDRTYTCTYTKYFQSSYITRLHNFELIYPLYVNMLINL